MPQTQFKHNERPRWEQVERRGVIVEPDAKVSVNELSLTPRVVFRGNVVVDAVRDHIVIGPIGSRSDYLTVTFNRSVQVTTGCLSETLEQFEKEVGIKIEGTVDRIEYDAALAFLKVLAETRGTPHV